jgi:hypothetical protein
VAATLLSATFPPKVQRLATALVIGGQSNGGGLYDAGVNGVRSSSSVGGGVSVYNNEASSSSSAAPPPPARVAVGRVVGLCKLNSAHP